MRRVFVTSLLVGFAACGPHANIPPRPLSVPGSLDPTDSGAVLAHALAPLLYVQCDEWFPLQRVAAVLHSARRIIAYHLLWQDDVNGSWIPFTVPMDEEVVWVGYDSTKALTDLRTSWHRTLLYSFWPRDRGQVAVDIQWGKHGSLPHGLIDDARDALGDGPCL